MNLGRPQHTHAFVSWVFVCLLFYGCLEHVAATSGISTHTHITQNSDVRIWGFPNPDRSIAGVFGVCWCLLRLCYDSLVASGLPSSLAGNKDQHEVSKRQGPVHMEEVSGNSDQRKAVCPDSKGARPDFCRHVRSAHVFPLKGRPKNRIVQCLYFLS